MNQFVVKVKYTKQLENGTFKRVSEPYLVNAYTFTDAEARIYEQLGQIIRGEFVVTNISRADFHDVFFYPDTDLWFKVKIKYMTADADSDKVKKVSQNFLISAGTVKEACERLQESLANTTLEFDITSSVVSPIIDVFVIEASTEEDAKSNDKEVLETEFSEED